eukprot:9040319-Pyramimonas_sp.AAC.1
MSSSVLKPRGNVKTGPEGMFGITWRIFNHDAFQLYIISSIRSIQEIEVGTERPGFLILEIEIAMGRPEFNR